MQEEKIFHGVYLTEANDIDWVVQKAVEWLTIDTDVGRACPLTNKRRVDGEHILYVIQYW